MPHYRFTVIDMPFDNYLIIMFMVFYFQFVKIWYTKGVILIIMLHSNTFKSTRIVARKYKYISLVTLIDKIMYGYI